MQKKETSIRTMKILKFAVKMSNLLPNPDHPLSLLETKNIICETIYFPIVNLSLHFVPEQLIVVSV